MGRFDRREVAACLNDVPAFKIVVAFGPLTWLQPDIAFELKQGGGRFYGRLAVMTGREPF
jgi:hypothetical protein